MPQKGSCKPGRTCISSGTRILSRSQRFPSLFRPGGPTLPLPVATATGGVATFYFSSSCSLRAIGSGVFAIATMESCRYFITGPLATSLRLASHRSAHTPYGRIPRFPTFFRPGGPASKGRWRELPVGIGGSFFPSSPGALRPRQRLCRPSGAGDVGERRVVYETHIVARASRLCGVGVCCDDDCSSHLPDSTIPFSLQARRAGIEKPVARALSFTHLF